MLNDKGSMFNVRSKNCNMSNVKCQTLNVRSETREARGKMLTTHSDKKILINSGFHNKDMRTTYMIFEMNKHICR